MSTIDDDSLPHTNPAFICIHDRLSPGQWTVYRSSKFPSKPDKLVAYQEISQDAPPHSQLPPLTPTQSSIMLFPHLLSPTRFPTVVSRHFLPPCSVQLPFFSLRDFSYLDAKLQYQSTALSPFDLQPQSSTLPLHSISTPMVSRTTPQDGVSTSIMFS